MSHLTREHVYERASNELRSAHHWVDANQGRDGQGPPTSPTSSKSAAMHWTNYRSVRGVPANLTHTFPLVGHGSGFGSPVPTQDPTRKHQHPPVTPQGKTGPPRSSKMDSKNAKEQLRKDAARSRVEEQDPGPVYIRNQKKDLAVLAANSGTNFLGYHTLAKDRTPEAVFMAPPEPYQAIPEYTTSKTAVSSGRSLVRGVVRRIPKAIEPGETLVMLFDDGPRVVQAVQRAPYLVYSVRARWTIIGSWNERKYAIVDPSSEIALQRRQWYRFVQPSEMQANDVRPLMQSCLERRGWEFVDARPPGWHLKRRENEVPFLEMIMNTEIDWDATEWMVGVAGYGE